jgi:hypothetical protein
MGFSHQWTNWVLVLLSTISTLNALFQFADTRCLLTAPLRSHAICHCVSLNIDDLVVFIVPTEQDITLTRTIFDLFIGASSLHTNVRKCQFTLIQCIEDQIALVHQLFLCQLVHFLCRYLGVPLSIYMLTRDELQPLLDSVVDRLL